MAQRARNCNISFRVTDAEREIIEAKRALAKMPMREFVFECIKRKPLNVKPGAPLVVGELKRIGNNLNQLTRNVNAGIITDCRHELQEIRAELVALRKSWQ